MQLADMFFGILDNGRDQVVRGLHARGPQYDRSENLGSSAGMLDGMGRLAFDH